MSTATADRTEKATPRRRKDARERGQVAHSRDLAGALAFVGIVLALAWTGSTIGAQLAQRIAAAFQTMGDVRGDLGPAAISAAVWADAGLFALLVAPCALIAAAVSITTSVAQTGWVFSPKALHAKWERLNPAAGFARFSLKNGGMELIKAIVGATVVTALCIGPIRALVYDAPGLMAMTADEIAVVAWDRGWALLWRAGLALAVLAGADYGLQRWRWLSGLKMTRQEVKDEMKASEGNPEIKARVRRVQREMSRRRMIGAVKEATVVITNPTHFAVALQYRRNEMSAPVVLAKGQDLMAARIRAEANKHGIPIVENVALARALYQGADVGDSIPAALFGAVAEVLAYLVRLKQLVL
jgi:flagellar biosynthetic protein FlhB